MTIRTAIGLALLPAMASPALADAAFYPARPAGNLNYVQGILTEYGHGNELGSFTIVDSKKLKHTFYMGKNMMIDGARVYCGRAPTATYRPDTTVVCPDWPTNITIGHSIVKAAFWVTTYQGSPVRASDSLTLVSP